MAYARCFVGCRNARLSAHCSLDQRTRNMLLSARLPDLLSWHVRYPTRAGLRRLATTTAVLSADHGDTKIGSFQKNLTADLESKYDSARVEEGWPREWAAAAKRESLPLAEQVLGKTDDAGRTVFRMVLPPPNITGDLHLGHALTVAIQDSMCRFRRLQGDRVIWLAGTDHAGIATQAVLERKIAKEANNNGQDLYRSSDGTLKADNSTEYRVKVANAWKKEKEANIFSQLERLGTSLSWQPQRLFTMDETMSSAVSEAFVRLYEQGLIYRQKRLVNWCPTLQSTLSDIEVDFLEVKPNQTVAGVNMGCMHNFAYPLLSGSRGDEVVVSTGRLETMLADVAVAVHPDDQRYSHLEHLKTLLEHPITGRKLMLIKDSQVDMNVGTGALKVTPAYSRIDWNMCQRHGIEDVIECLDDQGRFTAQGFIGDDRTVATEKIRTKLDQLGLYRGSTPVSRSIPICSRTGSVVDQRLKSQWYLKCKQLARSALEEVRSERVQMVPEFHIKVLSEWVTRSQDWCISRQLWWGHRVPAYRLRSASDHSDSWIVTTDEKAVPSGATQDLDVLDTWFSSALYPLVAFGWPKVDRPAQLDVMETGHDILYFWVARMLMMSLALTEQVPFKKVVLHGLLRDTQGRKMSKSLGNAIDPLHLIEGAPLERLHQETEKLHAMGYLSSKERSSARRLTSQLFPNGVTRCGADALRIALLRDDFLVQDIPFDVRQPLTSRNFCNKVWQGVRFFENAAKLAANSGRPKFLADSQRMATDSAPLNGDISQQESQRGMELEMFSSQMDEFDGWLLARLHETQTEMKRAFEQAELFQAVKQLNSFWVNSVCDIYLEVIKPDVWHTSDDLPRRVCVLREVVGAFLVMASPLMPYLTEELYHKLQLMEGLPREQCRSVHSLRWPIQMSCWQHNPDEYDNTTAFLNALKTVRHARQTEGLSEALKMLENLRLDERRIKIAYRLCHIKPEQLEQLKQSTAQT